jgi:hypothetical protein
MSRCVLTGEERVDYWNIFREGSGVAHQLQWSAASDGICTNTAGMRNIAV